MPPPTVQQLETAYKDGLFALRQKQVNKAQGLFEAILRAAPAHGPSHLQLGIIAQLKGVEWAAVKHLGQAAKLMPKEPSVWMKYASVLGEAGQLKKALTALGKADKLSPNTVDIIANQAHIHQQTGDFKAAERLLRRALKQRPKDGSLYRMLSIGRKFTADDPDLAAMIDLAAGDLPAPQDQWELDFAVSKALEDTGDYARSFTYLKRANDLAFTHYPYDADQRRAQIASMKASQSGVDYDTPVADHSDAAPIFVTGMPRSGTTLVEQIIAAHSSVTGLGETGFIARNIDRVLRQGQTYRPLADVADKLRVHVADKYAEDVAFRAPDAVRVVDKSIQTYLCFGAIKWVLPNAKFIVVRRDPRDNLLSIYRNSFKTGTHAYANDFNALADHYASFLDMIAFWKEVMPDAIYEVDYDALVADPEGQSRALIAAAGLEWEEQCLDFHKSKGAVKTLSLAQVRQPIYKSSQKAWQRYGDALDPLLDALQKRGIDVSD